MRDARIRALIAIGPIMVEGAPYRFRTLHPPAAYWLPEYYAASKIGLPMRPSFTLDQIIEVTLAAVKRSDDTTPITTVTVRL